MTTYSQTQDPIRRAIFVRDRDVYGPPPGLRAKQVSLPSSARTTITQPVFVNHKTSAAALELAGVENLKHVAAFDFFERPHVVPRSFDFGNVLSDQSVGIEVYNANRRDDREWSSFTSNAGTGVDLGSQPTLPADIDPSAGFTMTLEVSAIGDPIVDSTLDFVFTGGFSISVPIEIQRIVLFGATPESPWREGLDFLTQILTSVNGKEQRISLREFPRQSWVYRYLLEEGQEAQVLENLVFDYQARNFGVPVWFDDTSLTAAATSGDFSISVDSTSYRDFRAGGFAVVLTSQSTFDVAEIDTVGASSLTLVSALLNSYPEGTPVYPLSICRMEKRVDGSRYPVNLREESVEFTAIDNVADLADASPFATYLSKLLWDSGNIVGGTKVGQSSSNPFLLVDGGAGEPFQVGTQDRSRRRSRLTMRAEGRQAVWELRNLLRYLHGRQVSFFVPRDSEDLQLSAAITSGTNTMDVANWGYSQFVRARSPKDQIRIVFIDGSTPVYRTVSSATAVNATTDRLEVSSNWSSNIAIEDVERVEYVEGVRLDSDSISIDFDRNAFVARVSAPIAATLQ